jgi:N,N'-diacetyllegionaminate synthase
MLAKPFIIAEAGVNHNGELKLAFELIRAAKACGADAVKFQTYVTEKLAQKDTPKVAYQQRSCSEDNESHFEMLKKLELSYEDTLKVKHHCDELNIEFMSTPYDPESVDFLAEIGCQRIKVASADLVDFQIQNRVRQSGLTVIQSMGMATLAEVEAWNDAFPVSYPRTLLQCTSNYPCDPKNANLLAMGHIGTKFGIDFGFSDHTPDHRCAVLAVALGAKVIEKHFTLDKGLKGPDHQASCDIAEFKDFVHHIHSTLEILGSKNKRVAEEELNMRNVSRKGVFARKNLCAGQHLRDDDLEFRRPGQKMDMGRFSELRCLAINKDISAGTALGPDDFKA